jgi:hypothetical protein
MITFHSINTTAVKSKIQGTKSAKQLVPLPRFAHGVLFLTVSIPILVPINEGF